MTFEVLFHLKLARYLTLI